MLSIDGWEYVSLEHQRMLNRTLLAFIDLNDPFMAAEIDGEERPGSILSLVEARRFESLNLLHPGKQRSC